MYINIYIAYNMCVRVMAGNKRIYDRFTIHCFTFRQNKNTLFDKRILQRTHIHTYTHAYIYISVVSMYVCIQSALR
jgi:hypothetical protein